MTQTEALKILKTGANVFLTGEPGSGKTHTINQYVAWLRKNSINPSVTASTGIAATHIGGSTIHSWSGIGIKESLTEYDLDAITQNKRVSDQIRDTRVLIIDEVSMLSCNTLTMVDAVCRAVRRDPRPFGGLQVVLVGDFFQLPPIVRSEARAQEELSLDDEPASLFAFSSPAWDELNPFICYLEEQHRQEDAAFLDLLSAIRRNGFSEEHRALLRTRYAKTPKKGTTQLYAHNANVDTINDAELGKLKQESRRFEMDSRGNERLISGLKRGCLSPELLTLKIDAKVMFTKNDIARRSYVNGTLGTVTGFASETGYPIVKTHAGNTLVVEPVEWSVADNGKILATIIQLPLRLAWAMTVHKSQGMSLDAAHMDLSRAFEYGQGYVALSRVRTLEGLSLAGFNDRALLVHPDILARDAAFRELSDAAVEAFQKIPATDLAHMHAQFIKACAGRPQSKTSGTLQTEGSSITSPNKKRYGTTITRRRPRS